MKKSELKEIIKSAMLDEMDMTNAQDDDASSSIAGDYDPLAEEEESADDILARLIGTKADPYMAEEIDEAKEDDEMEDESRAERADVDKFEFEKGEEAGEEKASDSIVIDKKIVSLSSLPSSTRKILDSLETLRAQAEEFGDQKFMTQVGNTITFFTRDFVVAGDAPNPAGIEEVAVFAANPGAKMDALDIKAKSGFQPEDVLKAVHTAIALQLGKVPSSTAKGHNILSSPKSYNDVLAAVKEKRN
jgi:hypothetical protein